MKFNLLKSTLSIAFVCGILFTGCGGGGDDTASNDNNNQSYNDQNNNDQNNNNNDQNNNNSDDQKNDNQQISVSLSGLVSFNFEDVKSVITTENVANNANSESSKAVQSRDGRIIPTLEFVDGKKVASKAYSRENGGSSNLIGIAEDGTAINIIDNNDSGDFKVEYTLLSKDAKSIYIVLSQDMLWSGELAKNSGCMIFNVALSDGSFQCLDPMFVAETMDNDYRKAVSTANLKPIQTDEMGNIYYLGRPLQKESNENCWDTGYHDNNGNWIVDGQECETHTWYNFDYNVEATIRKIPVEMDENGDAVKDAQGRLQYGEAVSITPDNAYIQNFQVTKQGTVVYTYHNWEQSDSGIKMVIGNSSNKLTDNMNDWWGNFFYTIGDKGTIIYGSDTGSWGDNGLWFAQQHPVISAAKVSLKLDTSLFTSRGNSPTPSRVILGDDGYIYGLFHEDAGYWDNIENTWVSKTFVNLYRILPYKSTPLFSFTIEGQDWWQAMNNFDVQISKGYAYYVTSDKHPQALYEDRDIIKIVRLSDGHEVSLLDESEDIGQYTDWGDRYELYSWKLIDNIVYFSGFDSARSRVVTGEIDTNLVKQGQSSENYLTITDAASAFGASAEIKDMEVIRPAEVVDQSGEPRVQKIYTDPENLYSASIEFNKYMDRDSVNDAIATTYTKIIDGNETTVQVPMEMKVWLHKTVHIIYDNNVSNTTTDNLPEATKISINIDSNATDNTGWPLVATTDPVLSKEFTTVPAFGWYGSTDIAIDEMTDGSVAKYKRSSNSPYENDYWKRFNRIVDTNATRDIQVEMSFKILSDHAQLPSIRLSDAKKADWNNVDWSSNNVEIKDGSNNYWKWEDGYYAYDGHQYRNCNDNVDICKDENNETFYDAVYDENNKLYVYEEGYQADLDGNKYYDYWTDDSWGHRVELVDGGEFKIVWEDGYYQSNTTPAKNYKWSFGEYRNVDDSTDILDWSTGSYIWVDSSHKVIEIIDDNNGTLTLSVGDTYEKPGTEWVNGAHKADNGDVLSHEYSWSNGQSTWEDGNYCQLTGKGGDCTSTTTDYWDNDWTHVLPDEYLIANNDEYNWDGQFFRLDGWSFEYRKNTNDNGWINDVSNSLTGKKWYKLVIKSYNGNIMVTLKPEDGEAVEIANVDDVALSTQTASGNFNLDMKLPEGNLLIDNLIVKELDTAGEEVTDGILFNGTFENGIDTQLDQVQVYDN